MYTQYNYWRSTDRVAPHNVYTNGQSLIEALDKRGFGSKMDGPVEDPMFSFYKSEKEAQKGLDALKDVEGTIPCSHVTITYRPNAGMYIEPEYFYNEETKLYERSIYGGDQIDKETDERVTCKNIFIMITDLHPRGDSKGHMDITTIGEGKGYYICEGKAVPVIWKKESQEDTTKWYLENGDRLVMAPGKTWISILATSTPYTLE